MSISPAPAVFCSLPRTSNQARGIAEYALQFLREDAPPIADDVVTRVELFHFDSIACAIAARACKANAPLLLLREALTYQVPAGQPAAFCLGSRRGVQPEKAVLANCSAVRELDANGTNFGIYHDTLRGKGEFGHNDFYPVAVAAAQQALWNGSRLLRAMLCLDEIRGRLAAEFSLKDHMIDHVLHGAIASAAVYGAVLGATVDQIESAIGLVVAHHIPFRAIRHGHQLSDSKGASAAISAEAAVVCVRRAMRGFIGPADIFRNPQAIFCLAEKPPEEESPFDLRLALSGGDFAILDMHFKLGLYEHQSAGAIQGLIDVLASSPAILESADNIRRIRISLYQPAYNIICDPAKRDPQTRQSADHSMPYIVATLLRKALQQKTSGWEELMLVPEDYDDMALRHPLTRSLMERIDLLHGGPEFDRRYPEGIPTSVEIDHSRLGTLSSGLVMFPEGHARNTSGRLETLLAHKFRRLVADVVPDVEVLRQRMTGLAQKSPEEVQSLYSFELYGLDD